MKRKSTLSPASQIALPTTPRQLTPSAVAAQVEMGKWLEKCTSALLDLWMQKKCSMPWTHGCEGRGFSGWERRKGGMLRKRGQH